MSSSSISTVTKIRDAIQHVGRYFGNYDGRDKFLKLLDSTSELAGVILKMKHADESFIHDVESTNRAFKDARNVTGLFNIFAGILDAIIQGVLNALQLLRGFCKGEDQVKVTKMRNGKDDLEIYEGYKEMGAGLVSSAGSIISGMTYFIGFGILQPASFASKHFKNVGESAKRLGSHFPLMMVVNHFATMTTTISEIVRKESIASREDKPFFDIKDTHKLVLDFLSTAGDIAVDAITLTPIRAPIFVKLGINIFTSIIGITKVWLATRNQ
jgi:hypothetical protein